MARATWDPVVTGASIFLALVFAVLGIWKIVAAAPMPEVFAAWGFPGWLMVAVGVLELMIAALLAFRQTAFYGAGLLMALMLGGILTMLLNQQGPMAVSLVLIFCVAVLIAAARQPGRPAAPPSSHRWVADMGLDEEERRKIEEDLPPDEWRPV